MSKVESGVFPAFSTRLRDLPLYRLATPLKLVGLFKEDRNPKAPRLSTPPMGNLQVVKLAVFFCS